MLIHIGNSLIATELHRAVAGTYALKISAFTILKQLKVALAENS
jgi:hypothetical protein